MIVLLLNSIKEKNRGKRCTVPECARRGEQWYTIPLPSSPRAKKQKSCLIARARTSFFGWLNGPADLGRRTLTERSLQMHKVADVSGWSESRRPIISRTMYPSQDVYFCSSVIIPQNVS
ncbi:BQ5605_C006g04301 [Microbotryum silenes-dioicae]|uniref:BQ5605_C006g04301 protein n=1 Tax=Microbotryum silenes-dioicae TaxID=796604 RepID=A0A2X0P936_9BASI|nr:BQ5605_C006g04301 [Microbotryum silenes-dioicae]